MCSHTSDTDFPSLTRYLLYLSCNKWKISETDRRVQLHEVKLTIFFTQRQNFETMRYFCRRWDSSSDLLASSLCHWRQTTDWNMSHLVRSKTKHCGSNLSFPWLRSFFGCTYAIWSALDVLLFVLTELSLINWPHQANSEKKPNKRSSPSSQDVIGLAYPWIKGRVYNSDLQTTCFHLQCLLWKSIVEFLNTALYPLNYARFARLYL